MSSIKNNFIPDRPCMNSEEHIGREELIYRTFVRLSSDDVQNTVIIGSNKFGKTSFINYLQQQSVIQQYLGEKAEKYIFVSINLKEKKLKSKNEFFTELYQQVERLLSGISKLETSTDTEIINAWLKTHDKRLVVILDDLHAIIANHNYPVDFYESLRSWFSNNNYVGCIATSPFELKELAMPIDLQGSPFFNIFAIYHLGPLTALEAVKLLDSKLPEQFRSYPEETLEIIRQVGFNPYELQIAGFEWSSHFKKNKKFYREELLNAIQSHLKDYYEDIYKGLNPNQSRIIESLLKPSNKTKEIDNKLIENGWVSKHTNKLTALQMENFFQEKFFPKKHTMLTRWIAKKTVKTN